MAPVLERVLTALAIWCLVLNTRETAACIAAERGALVAFNGSIKDPNERLSSWKGENCCIWNGVRCSKKTGHVVQLDLGGYDLQGEINPSLAGLTNLLYLNLSQSDFGGVSIPEFIGSFKMLRYLDLSYAGFSGAVPPQLGNLSRLTYLDLSSYGFPVITVDIHWVSKLTVLRYLDLSWLYVDGSMDWLQAVNMLPLLEVIHLNGADLPVTNLNCLPHVNFTTLKILDLKDNNLSSSLPNWIWNLSSISELDLSSCGLYGRIPDELGKLTSLKFLALRNNSISGEMPAGMGKLSNLTHLDIALNSLEGRLSELHFVNLSRLDTLVLSLNSLKIVTKHGWVPPFQLKVLEMHACLVGPQFPFWLKSQTRIEMIDLGSAGISAMLPDWIWNFSLSITTLDVSTNNISGKLPASLAHLKMLTVLIMRYNQLEGSIPDLPTGIIVLDLSHNNLSGSFPQSLREVEIGYLLLSNNFLSGGISTALRNMVHMEVIDLSNNSLSGELPKFWHPDTLSLIDFSSNNFWGEIPSTIGSLINLDALHLRKNNLSGILPTSLQLCIHLEFLDLGDNNLSGNIPKWIGDDLQGLVFLSLGSNQFSGEIPEELSQLHDLRYLDFSNNKLSGQVPRFLGNLTALQGARDEVSFQGTMGLGAPFSVYVDTFEISYKGRLWIFISHYLANGIDLSGNQITGEIPSEIGFLSSLLSLNLSRNHIGGSIPDEIGSMSDLESLDLSWNDLSGSIPQSLTSASFLSYLNLSYNELSGKIPLQGQFLTFTGDSYLGNVNLCGVPLSRMCLPKYNSNHYPTKNNWEHFDTLTYMCSLLGFATGFSIVCLTLISSAAARMAYFQFVDGVLHKLHTATDMKLHISRMLGGRDLSLPTGTQNSITRYSFFGGPSTAV